MTYIIGQSFITSQCDASTQDHVEDKRRCGGLHLGSLGHVQLLFFLFLILHRSKTYGFKINRTLIFTEKFKQYKRKRRM